MGESLKDYHYKFEDLSLKALKHIFMEKIEITSNTFLNFMYYRFNHKTRTAITETKSE